MCCLLEGKMYITDKYGEVCENEGKSAKLAVLINLHIRIAFFQRLNSVLAIKISPNR